MGEVAEHDLYICARKMHPDEIFDVAVRDLSPFDMVGFKHTF